MVNNKNQGQQDPKDPRQDDLQGDSRLKDKSRDALQDEQRDTPSRKNDKAANRKGNLRKKQ